MARSQWMARWYERKDWPPARRLGWLGDNERLFCDWEDSIADGWPAPDKRQCTQIICRKWDVDGVQPNRIYTDEEERELHARQDRNWRLRHRDGEEMLDLRDSTADDGTGPMAVDAGLP